MSTFPFPSPSRPPPPPARAVQWFSKLQLLFLHPNAQSDHVAADFETVYPRIFVIEYIFSVAMVTYICVYAFVTLRTFCDRNAKLYYDDLLPPYALFSRYGIAGYDGIIDTQWSSFTNGLVLMVIIFPLIALITFICRCASVASMIGASPPPDSTSQGVTEDDVSSIAWNDDSVNSNSQRTGFLNRSIRYSVLSNKQISTVLRVVCAVAGKPYSLPVFYAMAGTVFLAVAHGPYFLLPMLIITANYLVFSRLQRLCPYWLFMAIMWTTHVTLLYIIDVYGGFEQMYWVQYCFTTASNEQAADSAGHNRKPLWHVYMLWWVAYRMTMLRLIAFNYDLWESTHAASHARERATVKHDTICVECAQLHQQNAASPASLPAEASRCYKYRTEYARDAADYNFVNYIAYVLFPPLYLAGPMSSFNAFVSYMRVPSTSMPLRKMVGYLFSILSTYLTTLFVLHSVHIPALAKHSYLIAEMTFIEQSHYFFFSLAYLWLKFNFFWKSSRLFAMLSGIEAPEDMRRCFNSAYTVREFWRDWHASFNLWVVRYMYIPMGGRSRVALSVLPIFLFIAVWHDPALHLIKWALCIAVMFVVELVVSELFGRLVAAFRREMAAAAVATPGMTGDTVTDSNEGTDFAPPRNLIGRLAKLVVRSLSPLKRAWAYRALRILGGIGSISGLIFANLVGFSMQNEHSSMEKVGTTQKSLDADTAFVRTLRQVTLPFLLGYFFFLYCTLSIGILTRDMEANELRSLKKLYKLT